MTAAESEIVLDSGSGEVAERVRLHDWASTPLGHIERWPDLLRTFVQFVQCARQPMFIVWGQARTFLYNDQYVAILRNKHPWALGRAFHEVWDEAPEAARRMDAAFGGAAIHVQDLVTVLERSGHSEEASFNFSYTPIRDATGTVQGVLCACTETTDTVHAMRALEQKEAGLRVMLEQSAVGILHGDIDGGITFANDRACVILGRPRAALMGLTLSELTDARDRARSTERTRDLIKGGPSFTTEQRYVRGDGSSVWSETTVSAVRDGNGRAVHLLAIIQDITSRKRTADIAAFRVALSEMLRTADDAGKVASDTVRLMGRQLGAATVSFLAPDGDWENPVVCAEYRRDSRDTGNRVVLWRRLMALARDGARVIANVETDPALDAETRAAASVNGIASVLAVPLTHAGTVGAAMLVQRAHAGAWTAGDVDLTIEASERAWSAVRRLRAEAALRDSERQLRTIADTAPAMLWMTDDTNACTFVSRGWLEFTGQTESQALGHGWLDAVADGDLGELGQLFLQAARARGPMSLQFRVRRYDGELRWVIGEGRPRVADDGSWLGYSGSIIDVHDWKLATQALQRSDRELRDLSRSLEDRVTARTAELRQQSMRLRRLASELGSAEQRERKRLAAILHDEVQQFLFAAMMRLGTAKLKSQDDAAREAVAAAAHHIDEALLAARDLTQQLRPPALYEAGLAPALGWLAARMRERHGLTVRLDLDGEELPLPDDAKALLFESVRELLFNVVKYAGVDVATVRLASDNAMCRIAVVDEGAGFDSAKVATEAHNESFGLFSIRERLAALGGQLILRSSPGAGTHAILEMPMVALRADPAPGATATTTAALRSERHRDDPVHVLVVDDHAIVRQGLATIIESDAGLSVVGEAADGLEALHAVQQFRPDVVLIDLNMPRMNGVEATREIRRQFPSTRVIGLSVQDDEATATSMRSAGAAAFVPKAGDANHLLRTIHSVAAAEHTADAN